MMNMRSYSESCRDQETPGAVDTAVSRGLGWASIGIGVAEIAAPRKIQETLGIGNGENTGILRVLGVREICHGVDILSHDDPTPGVWSRVAGDVLDGVLLALAARRTKNPPGFAAVTASVLGIALLDVIEAKRLSRGD